MKEYKCPECGQRVEIQETENKSGLFKFVKHKVTSFIDRDENVHFRNVRDKICPGSEMNVVVIKEVVPYLGNTSGDHC